MSSADSADGEASAKTRRTARRVGWLVIAAVTVAAAVAAATASRTPATEAERAYRLKEATLCPVCDGQSVLESNAPAAAAMRRQIDLWVDADRSDAEIRADLAAAYGDDVNALPSGEGVGTLVWALPIAAFAAAAAGLWVAVRRWRVQEAGGATESGAGDATEPQRRSARKRRTRLASVVTVSSLVVIGALAGVAVARSAGLRLSGETVSGDIDRSARSLLVDAQRQFAANQLDEARATLEEVFRLDRDLRGARVLSARLHLRQCESLAAQGSGGAQGADGSQDLDSDNSAVEADDALGAGCELQSALEDLDRVLTADPRDAEALALRGWLLVRIPDRELIAAGLASLDAAVALNPGEFDPFVFRGYAARFIEGDLPGAIGYYQAALERGPPPAMAAALNSAIAEMRAEQVQQSLSDVGG
ncbi:cytochrome c-type biogenesis protein CcmH [Candidatus Poriferisodalis sp.]|uniref:cytochrome c-type biogenesis protein CcmH n=1 Tax=Candidatus Poriferisodalis sp. TaxID=3101277 RepID=UPI003B0208F5